MKLERIITLANNKSKMQFLAMVRSLRSTGCDLPVWVIPYDDNIFDLPENCIWWNLPEITNWTKANNLWPAFRKVQCFTIANYQFVDSDVIFFKNPEDTLKDQSGFITSCTHWSNPAETLTPETAVFFKEKSSTWPKLVFNSGQWACDRQLYEALELMSFCENNFKQTLFLNTQGYKDQAGINILVNYKNVPITNLTLPPVNMNSTWAGDYISEVSFRNFEQREKPYLIHWAGVPSSNKNFINSYMFSYLTEEEGATLLADFDKKKQGVSLGRKIKSIIKIIKQ